MDTKTIEAVMKTVTIDTKIDGGKVEAVIGERARMEVERAVCYIKSGKAEIDAAVDARLGEIDAEGQEYVDLAKQWAIGDPTEPIGNSSKYWAEQSASAAATVNDATLTIQKNGATVGTFTANASVNATANISVPTDTGDLTNNAGFITGITSGDVTTALGYTPYNSSNPSGYISSAAVSSLTDVTLSGLSNGDVLIYNSTSQKWENSAGGGGMTMTYDNITKTLTWS